MPIYDNEKLKKYFDNSGLKKNKLADELNVSYPTLQRKLDGEAEWTLSQLQVIKKMIPNEKEFLNIFFKN